MDLNSHQSFESPKRPPIPGYTMNETLEEASFTLQDLESLKKSLLMGEEDIKALRMSKPILVDQTNAILDVWYNFVGSTPELAIYFSNLKTQKLDDSYLAAVRKRFEQWIIDTADAKYDQQWLNYQYEIGLRHAPEKKNKTDGADSTKFINFRYIPALTIPVTTTLKPFLAKSGASAEDVEKMHSAWVKSVLMQAILWSYPFVKKDLF